jgi:hypothetical protein
MGVPDFPCGPAPVSGVIAGLLIAGVTIAFTVVVIKLVERDRGEARAYKTHFEAWRKNAGDAYDRIAELERERDSYKNAYGECVLDRKNLTEKVVANQRDHIAELEAENAKLKALRDNVCVELLGPGGLRFEDMPDRARQLRVDAERHP